MDDPASIFFLLATGDTTAAEPASYAWSAVGVLSVALLVAANGFFVASEFALVAVRKSRIEAMAADGASAK